MAEKKTRKERKEIGNSCVMCKKPLKRVKRYYRDGSYYCNNNCYTKKVEEDAKAKQEAAA